MIFNARGSVWIWILSTGGTGVLYMVVLGTLCQGSGDHWNPVIHWCLAVLSSGEP